MHTIHSLLGAAMGMLHRGMRRCVLRQVGGGKGVQVEPTEVAALAARQHSGHHLLRVVRPATRWAGKKEARAGGAAIDQQGCHSGQQAALGSE